MKRRARKVERFVLSVAHAVPAVEVLPHHVPARWREEVLVVVRVEERRQGKLSQVRPAHGRACLSARPAQCRQQDRRQRPYNRNHDQQFNQRETAFAHQSLPSFPPFFASFAPFAVQVFFLIRRAASANAPAESSTAVPGSGTFAIAPVDVFPSGS